MKKIFFFILFLITVSCSTTNHMNTLDCEYNFRMYQIIYYYQIRTYGMSYDTTSLNYIIEENHQESE